MFTGIIEYKGIIKEKTASRLHVETNAGIVKQLSIGASVSISGACLTVTDIPSKTVFSVEVMPETFRKTTLRGLKTNSPVNLELPLKVGGRFGGHIVQGHIDGMATIKKIQRSGNSYIYYFNAPAKLLKYMVEKGSVAINGIALTLIDVTKSSFSVGVIPHTKKSTSLATAKVGEAVNVETDLFAKYIYKFSNHK